MPPQPLEIGCKCILDRPRAGRRPNRPRSACRSLWISEGGGGLLFENAVSRSGTPTARGKWRRVGGAVLNVFSMSTRTRRYRLFAQRTRTRGLSAIRRSPTSPKFWIFEKSWYRFPESLSAGSHARCWSYQPHRPIPWHRVVRGGSVVHTNFFGYRMRTRRDVAL